MRRNSVFLAYIFRHSGPKTIFFGHFKNISVCDRKNPRCWHDYGQFTEIGIPRRL